MMALAIDKFRSAKEGSSKRSSKWLMERIDETIELAQQDENITFVEKALQTTGGKQVPANPGKPDEKDKRPKPSKEKEKSPKREKPKKEKDKDKSDKPKRENQKGQTADASTAVSAAPGPSKGSGKGKKPLSKEEKAQQPCMYYAYYAFSSCTKGDTCPYLHDKNNLYKGPKPKPLEKNTPAGSATVHAGAAKLLAGSIAASSVVGAKGVSSLSAPHLEAESRGNVAL